MTSFKNIVQFEEPPKFNLLKMRTKEIENYSVLGTCDMFYLTWTNESLMKFGNKKTKYTFFYAFGLDTSSPSSIGAYINGLLSSKEKGSWSSSEWKAKKVLFCIFDAFNRIDIHLEFNIPGQMSVQAFDIDGKEMSFDEIEWEPVYISSVLRSLTLQSVKVGKFYNLLSTKEKFFEFLHVIERHLGLAMKSEENKEKTEIQMNNRTTNLNATIVLSQNMSNSIFKDIPFDAEDLLKTKGNALMNFLCSYFIDRRLISIGVEFFASLVTQDKRYFIFLVELLLKTPHQEETIKSMASILEGTPHIILFLFKEAQILVSKGKYKDAVPLFKAVLQLNPNSCEGWVALAEAYFLQKNYIDALFTLNAMPFYTTGGDVEDSDDNFCYEMRKISPSYPAILNSITNCPDYFTIPKSSDFLFDNICDEMTYLQSGDFAKSEKLVTQYRKLPARKLTPKMKAAYKILVKISREIGWDQLLSLRAHLFVIEAESDSKTKTKRKQPKKPQEEPEPAFGEDYSIKGSIEDELDTPSKADFENGQDMKNSSFFQLDGLADNRMEKILTGLNEEHLQMIERLRGKEKKPKYIKVGKQEKEDAEMEAIGLMEDNESPTIYETEGDFVEKSKEKLKGRKNKIGFADTTWKQLEEEEKEFETKTKKGGKKKPVYTSKRLKTVGKRLCTKEFDELFDFLYKDNNAYFDFLEEEKSFQILKESKNEVFFPRILYSGEVWIERGKLCDRLLRNRSAEKSYSIALSIGFSMFAVMRLMELYGSTNNPKSCLVTAIQMLDFYLKEGFKDITFLPVWAERVVLEVIEDIGESSYLRILKELGGDRHAALVNIANHNNYWNGKNFSVNELLRKAVIDSKVKTKPKTKFMVINEDNDENDG